MRPPASAGRGVSECQWPRGQFPVAPGRERAERRQLPVPSELSRTGGLRSEECDQLLDTSDQPQRVTSDRDRPALRSPGREASIRDVGTFRLRVTPASAQGEQRYHGQWPVARVSSEGSPEPSEGTL